MKILKNFQALLIRGRANMDHIQRGEQLWNNFRGANNFRGGEQFWNNFRGGEQLWNNYKRGRKN